MYSDVTNCIGSTAEPNGTQYENEKQALMIMWVNI